MRFPASSFSSLLPATVSWPRALASFAARRLICEPEPHDNSIPETLLAELLCDALRDEWTVADLANPILRKRLQIDDAGEDVVGPIGWTLLHGREHIDGSGRQIRILEEPAWVLLAE